mmetsp:Transcript_2545/g.4303  ORF Transcript_2545/g.4303 Transcript_2545/m.4303 type:complete len:238 (-) Transcript_2545:910-1623(-)
MVPRRIGHVEIGSIRFSAKGHALNFNQRDLSKCNQFCVSFHLVGVPALDNGQSSDSPLALVLQQAQRLLQPFPSIRKQRPVNGNQALWSRCIDTHVQLGDRYEGANGFGMLSIGDQKRRNVSRMKVSQEFIDSRVHDWFSYQRQGAVSNSVSFLPPFHVDAWDALCFLNHFHVSLDSLIDNVVRIICFPFPFFTNRILVMPPAKDALVGTRQRRGRLHALIRCNTIESVFVATSPST